MVDEIEAIDSVSESVIVEGTSGIEIEPAAEIIEDSTLR